MIKNGLKLSATDHYCNDLFPGRQVIPSRRCGVTYILFVKLVLGLTRKKFKLLPRIRLYREFILILYGHAYISSYFSVIYRFLFYP